MAAVSSQALLAFTNRVGQGQSLSPSPSTHGVLKTWQVEREGGRMTVASAQTDSAYIHKQGQLVMKASCLLLSLTQS